MPRAAGRRSSTRRQAHAFRSLRSFIPSLTTRLPIESRDVLLGSPLCRIYERSATAPLPPDARPPATFRIFVRRTSKILGWWLGGLGRPNPFFDGGTTAPISVPRVLKRGA